ncbi:MAG TPA: hypothetical protein ENI33_00130, partial [Thermoplasmatales archaeon]|nr:hypothetical protein [Thermoplasmatales archaeon]
MKKIIGNKIFLGCFILLLWVFLSGIDGGAGGGTGTVVSIQDCLVDAGDSITIPIMIYNVTNMGDAEINLSFDSSVVNVLSFSGGDFDLLVSEINNSNGWARAGGTKIFGNLSGDVVLANITLQAVGVPGETSPLNFTHILIHDATPQGNVIPASPQNGTFTINDTLPPQIENITASPNPQEVGGYVNITCNVTDAGGVNIVKVNITGPPGFTPVNTTMNTGSYYYNVTYLILGTYHYFIWANDTSGNSNVSATYTFTIHDTTLPEIRNVSASPQIQETGSYVNITCNVTDNVAVNVVKVNITYPDNSYHNFSMNGGSYYYNATYSMIGTYHYFIWANDTSSNSNKTAIYSFYIYDPSVVYVDDDFDASTVGWQYDHFNKIQDGINAVNEGGIVYIFNGTYNENVDVGKTVSIIGNGSANCIVQSFTNDDVFYVNANWVNISGLTVKGAQSLHAGIHLYYVTHCNISNVNASDSIYGIYLDYSNNNILINNTAFFNDYYGIYSVYSDYNTLIENNCSYNSDGIYLYFSDYNVLKNNTAMENNHWDINIYSASYNTIENTTGSGNRPIAYYDSNVNIANATFSELILWNADYSVFTNITIEGSANLDNNGIILSETDYATLTYINSSNNFYGLWLKYSNNNHLSNLICTGGDTGIYLFTSDYNTISNSNFSNNEIGIYMYGYHQNGNAFYNDTAFNELYSAFSADDDSHGNIVENLSVASYPTRMSFTFDNGIRVRGVDSPPPNPAGMGDIGKYVNITNITANSWINISIYYEDAELGLVEEDTLRMWRYNGTTWEMVSQPNNVSIADNYVYANITSFSIFAPLGELPMPVQNLRTGELFMTIQSAINDNDTIDGDTIIVYESVFRENVLVNKSLILKAGSSPIIDGMGGIAITIVVDNVTVEGFDITNSSTGIYVHNALFTIQNVTIRNCNIYNCTGGNGVGIKFENVNKSGITGCEIYNNTLWGIQLSHSSNNTIYNNTVYNHTAEWNSAGIVVFSSSNYNNISSNIVYNNEIDNIELWNNSFYNEIWNNTVYGAEYGILLSRNANNNTMIKNTIYNNTYGIGIGHSNTTWGGAANNNLVLKNIIISSEYIGIYLFNSTFNNISYNNLSTNFVGVQLQFSNWSVIISNNILFNLAQGIYLCYSNNNTIMNNTAISNWGTGIKLEHSSNNNLMDNILYNDSIYLTYSHYNTLSYNTILNNSEHELGIYLHYSDNNTVSSNFAYSNFAGITLFGSCENNTIFDCVIINNDYGILIGGNIYAVPSNNTIYNNYFDNIINAYVGGNNINNIWNVSKTAGTNIVGGPYIGGNYWSDYNGTDTDGDGLGDTNLPYNAGGNITKGGDWLPLVARVYNLNQDRWYYYIQSAIDNASNGDTIVVHDGTYKENVVIDKEITLINGSKPIIDGMGGIAFNITANNVSIIGFNITNSSYGIKCNASGFYIANNTFWYDRIGFRWNIEERPTEDYTIYDGIVEKNKFYMNKDYKTIFAYISLDYNGNGPYNVTIGNITIWDNTFYMNGSNAIGVHISEEIGDLYGGNISAGTVNISNNKIYGGWGAVDFSGDFYDLTDVNVSAGDVIINKNIMLNQLLGGVSTDYYSAGLWNGNTTGIFGDLIINGNKIYSSSLGIYISPEGFGAIMHDNATAVLGFTNISNNIINSGKHGIYFYAGYLGYEMYENTSIGVGKFIIHNNNITANDNYDGIHICAEYWGYNMSRNSSCIIGNFKIVKNNVSCKSGIYFEYFRYVGYNLSDNASVVIGDFAINDNTINATEDGIYFYTNKWACNIHNNSYFCTGEFEFIGNEIEVGGKGLYLLPYWIGYYMYDNAMAMIGNWCILDNNVTSGDYGIDTGPRGIGTYMYDNASIVIGDFIISHNNIFYGDGVFYYLHNIGTYMYNNTSIVIGDTKIDGNTVNILSFSYAICVYYDYVANAMFDNSSLFIGDVYIENNPALNAFDRDAIYVEYYNENVGDGLYGNSSARLPDYIIRNNTINASDDGISMYTKHNPDYMYNNSSI